jgi:outer membrane protein TolC
MRRSPRGLRPTSALVLLLIGTAAPLAAPARDEADDAAATSAPAGERVSLAEVLEVAVKRSPDLASATLDAEVARAQVLSASGVEDFLLSAAGSFGKRKALSLDGDGAVVGTEIATAGFEAGLSKLLPSGGTVAVTTEFAKNETGALVAGMPSSVAWTAQAQLAVDQPILRGFGPTAAFAARTQAEHAARAAELGKRTAAQAMVRDLIAAYWEVAFAHADLEIRRSSLELARERRRLTKRSADLGQVAPTEVVAVDQIIATREEEILSAELTVTERSLELRRLAGMEIDASRIDLVPSEALAAEPRPANLDAIVESALDNSPEIEALAAQGRGARIEVDVAENGLLPRLDLGLAIGPTGIGAGFGDAFGSMTSVDGYEASASLRFEYGLGDRAGKGRAAAARANMRKIKVDQRALRNQVTIAAVQAAKLQTSAQKRIALGATAIELSEKNVKAETGRFELGKSTNFDVLARQEELKQARLRRARAVVDYLRAVAIIDALTGDILDKYGVAVD